ncbi:MAG: membrane protein insertion efficiency factor YidD [Alphaproteobacteria bacterium]|nr:membrane protein insertion efficiency factor YidD [Alphaproteobacteria bacterium]MBR4806841.1 membrane protein insertion efficiency factor YidD [Alphaproteobacteria bacterium]
MIAKILKFPRHIGIAMIWFYQRFISPAFGGRAACRFTPTCSEYAKTAILRYGLVRGTAMGIRRILRCRPGGGFGFDPVP